MANAIRTLEVQELRLTAAEAVVWLQDVPERRSETTEVRGRFVGPRCSGRSTVEVAYPLRPVPGGARGSGDLAMRVVIPEPSFWASQSPYQYEGTVELWDEGKRCDVRQITLRLGHSGS